MEFSRREFVKVSAMAGAGLLLAKERAWAAYAQSPTLQKFIQPLRMFGPDIPVLTPNVTRYSGVDYYTIDMRQYTDLLHPGLPPTKLYGYGAPGSTFKHLGGAIVAQKGTPVRVTWQNHLPGYHLLPMDTTQFEDYDIDSSYGANRAAPHLHGGFVPWPSDGGPYHWFSSTLDGAARLEGPSVVKWLPENDANGVATGQLNDDYYYPNNQSARLMWYHDHAVAITRLNAYAGLATGYILTDTVEAALMSDPTRLRFRWSSRTRSSTR